ncbi:hypothetical protein HDU86_007718 [Geranomyces michiganensis]|nr:hypothetical protein HDU86_007718 [Geranomyces michiganensis]
MELHRDQRHSPCTTIPFKKATGLKGGRETTSAATVASASHRPFLKRIPRMVPESDPLDFSKVNDEEVGQVLDDIRERYSRRWWNLCFYNEDMERTFLDYAGPRRLEKNKRVALVFAGGERTHMRVAPLLCLTFEFPAALTLFPFIVWLGGPRPIAKVAAPVLLASALESLLTYLLLKYIVARRPELLRKQHHIVGVYTILTILNLLVLLEAVMVPYSRDYDMAAFDSHVKHQFVVAIYIALSSTYKGMGWCYAAAIVPILGNYVTLTYGFYASPRTFLTSMAAYGLSAFTATVEAYLMEGKARDVFLMETIVTNSTAIKPGAAQLERTADLVADIRAARLQRQGVNDAGASISACHRYHIRTTRDVEQSESNLNPAATQTPTPLAVAPSMHRRGSPGMQEEDNVSVALAEEPIPGVERVYSHADVVIKPVAWARIGNAIAQSQHQVKQFFRQRWKMVYLAWADEYQ